MLKRVNKWYSQFKKYLFSYKDGYWELPFLLNSPDLLVESLAKMPFNKRDKAMQTITSNNPFMKGVVHYHKLEAGLYLHVVQTEFKANVSFRVMYDENPSVYYSLGYYVQKPDELSPVPTMNGVQFYNQSFTFNKPGVGIDAAYHKGTSCLFINVFFNQKWLTENILHNAHLFSDNLHNFLKSDQGTIIWPNLIADTNNSHQNILDVILKKDVLGGINNMLLKVYILELVSSFCIKISNLDLQNKQIKLADFDRKSVLKAEKILMDSLLLNFPGIENIAIEVGISPTKLKAIFKEFFGKTMFEYYQQKQMHYAKIKLEEKQLMVKEVANLLGYSNIGKFSASFKKHFGILPSDLKQK